VLSSNITASSTPKITRSIDANTRQLAFTTVVIGVEVRGEAYTHQLL
jgi:hypothetical protein